MDTFQTTFDRGELDKQIGKGGRLITTWLLINRPTSVSSILALHNKYWWLSTIKPAYAPAMHVDPCALKNKMIDLILSSWIRGLCNYSKYSYNMLHSHNLLIATNRYKKVWFIWMFPSTLLFFSPSRKSEMVSDGWSEPGAGKLFSPGNYNKNNKQEDWLPLIYIVYRHGTNIIFINLIDAEQYLFCNVLLLRVKPLSVIYNM